MRAVDSLDARLCVADGCGTLRLGRAEQIAARCSRKEIPELSLVDDLSPANDRDPVAELLDLVEQMTREQNRDSFIRELANETPHIAHPCRVEPGRRLVEQKQAGTSEQCGGDTEPLAHPVRVAANAVLRAVAQLDELQHLIDP